MQKVIYREQISEYADYLNQDMTAYLNRDLTESFEGFDNCDIITFQWYDVTTDNTDVSQITIYIDREDLFFICEDDRAFAKCYSLLTQARTNEWALYTFLVGLLAKDAKMLEQLEADITDAEDEALKDSQSDYLENIREFRKELLRLKRYYEELNTITDHLVANDNGLFTKDGVRHFSIVHNRISHFCSNVTSLRDYVNQMREACQGQIDIEQNRLMRVFTVVATIFLPLSLIVGWYGMNFEYMPELSWKYGYLGIIILVIIVVVGLVLWFKHKKWL